MNFRTLLEPLYERYLRMQCTEIPVHVAIIQDGNRRFAKEMGIDTAHGHRAGADKTEEMLDFVGIAPRLFAGDGDKQRRRDGGSERYRHPCDRGAEIRRERAAQ